MSNGSTDTSRLMPWKQVIKEQQELLEDLRRTLETLHEEEKRLAAKAAVEKQDGLNLALVRLRSDIKNNLEDQEAAKQVLAGAAILREEQDHDVALQKRRRTFKHAKRLAQQRESLAGSIERGVVALAKDFKKLEESGRKLAEITPEQPGWLRASHPVFGDPLLRHLRLSFLQAGLRLDSALFVDSGQLGREPKFRARIVSDDRAYLNIEKEKMSDGLSV